LTRAFVTDLSNIMDVQSRQRPTFTVTLDAAASAQSFWVVDVDCTLVGVYNVQGGGNQVALGRSPMAANVVNASGGVTVRKVIAWFQGTALYSFIFCREEFKTGERIYWKNDSAGAAIVLLVFES
jgi:hypothetical protein